MDVVSVTSPIGFWRAFLKLKVGGDSRRHLGSASLPDNRKWAQRRDVGGAGCWNRAHSSGHALNFAYQIKSNKITFIVTSPQHVCLGEWNSWERAPDSAERIYIQTVHTYRLIEKTMYRIHIHILSTHSVLFKTYLQLSIHVVYRMYKFYIMYTYIHTMCEGAADFT